MSDIAMLIAEEYERRAKNIRKGGAGNMVSCASLLVFTQRLKEKVGAGKRDLLNWVSEPKTQIAIAALNSSFSA